MDKNARSHTSVALLLIALFSLVFVFSPVQRAEATIAISSISPDSGYVGDTITVDGTINTTNFTVRWNGTAIVATGQTTDGNVHTSFVIPQTVGNRNVTVELIDDAFPGTPSSPMNFTLLTRFSLNATVPTPPRQLQEGSTVPIAVNVTGAEGNRVYTANITVRNPANQNTSVLAPLSNTTTTGAGNVTKIYPTDFVAHMNYTGKYVVTSNVTNIAQEFTVGLTDKHSYRRNETVQIQAAGYRPSEPVLVNITRDGSSVASFPQNITAGSAGLLTLSWKVPMNATVGTYMVSVTNATLGGTIKTPADLQTFDILGVRCSVQTTNNADAPVQNALVEVYNATASNGFILRGTTNLTGWIGFNLDSGNYTFKVFFLNVQVGTKNQSLTMDTSLIIKLNLVDLVATVKTVAGSPVPFVDIALRLNFTARDNKTTSQTLSMLTNVTGTAKLRNLFTNETYQVEARRYSLLFANQTLAIEPSPTSAMISLELTLPTYTMNVHVIDSKTAPVSGVEIRVYEWASGVTNPLTSFQTSASGDGSFSLPFGIYRLKAYEGDVFLGETLSSLVQNQSDFTFNLSALNVDVTVTVLDYFGRPIANAIVEIERKIAQEYLPIDNKSTGADGSATFLSILGGDSRISVYVAGKLVAARIQLLDGTSSQVTFNIGEYVAIVGYPVETSLFVLFSFMIVLIILLVIINRKRIVQVVRRKPAR